MHIVCLIFAWYGKDKFLSGNIDEEKPSLSPLFIAFLPYLLESLGGRIDVLTFSLFSSVGSLGQYAGISALMLPVGIISSAMSTGSTAGLDWTTPSIVRRYLKKTLILLVCLLLILLVAGISLGPYLLKTFLGQSFEGGYWMIPWIAVVVVTQSCATQFHSALQLSGRLKPYLTVQTLEAFLRIALVVLFGFYFSELGILLGLTVSSIVKIVFCVFLIKK
jgi:O-antigen/teichoic acid export membrane protein